MKTIKVQVTQECIDNGVKDKCRECPVAQALIKAGFDTPEVYSDKIQYWVNNDHVSAWACTEEVTDFIELYDDGNPVKPFEFEMTIDD
jgi:hypothetical protein